MIFMNVYDFDGTIYNGESNRDLILFTFKSHPFLVLFSLTKALVLYIKYKFKKVPFERVKETMLSFIFKIDNYDKLIDSFVEKNIKKIKSFYLDNKKDNDVLLSASYDLWINKFAKKLGIKNVISTNVNNNGKIIGKNCKGKEKVKRFKEFSNKSINCAYGDRESDKYILNEAKEAYMVRGNKLIKFKGM